MIKHLKLNDFKIEYNLEFKKIKNINLRIKNDGSVYVSAPKQVSENTIEKFLISKSVLILKAGEIYKKLDKKPLIKYFDESEIKDVILSACENVYPFFEKKGIKYPEIKFKKMVSRWGSCHPGKGILNFNINLMYVPIECIDYVVKHEFTHFLQPNHQKVFYAELSKICPNWKECKSILKSIKLK